MANIRTFNSTFTFTATCSSQKETRPRREKKKRKREARSQVSLLNASLSDLLMDCLLFFDRSGKLTMRKKPAFNSTGDWDQDEDSNGNGNRSVAARLHRDTCLAELQLRLACRTGGGGGGGGGGSELVAVVTGEDGQLKEADGRSPATRHHQSPLSGQQETPLSRHQLAEVGDRADPTPPPNDNEDVDQMAVLKTPTKLSVKWATDSESVTKEHEHNITLLRDDHKKVDERVMLDASTDVSTKTLAASPATEDGSGLPLPAVPKEGESAKPAKESGPPQDDLEDVDEPANMPTNCLPPSDAKDGQRVLDPEDAECAKPTDNPRPQSGVHEEVSDMDEADNTSVIALAPSSAETHAEVVDQRHHHPAKSEENTYPEQAKPPAADRDAYVEVDALVTLDAHTNAQTGGTQPDAHSSRSDVEGEGWTEECSESDSPQGVNTLETIQ